MFSIKNLLKLNPIRSTIIITSCLISSLLTVFVRYNLTWQADLLKENNIQGFLYLSLISLIAYILSSILIIFYLLKAFKNICIQLEEQCLRDIATI